MTHVWVLVGPGSGMPNLEGRWFAADAGDQSAADAARDIARLSWVRSALTDDEYQSAVRWVEMDNLTALRRMTLAELEAEAEYRERRLTETRAAAQTNARIWLMTDPSIEVDSMWIRTITAEVARRKGIAAAIRTAPWGGSADFARDLKARVALPEFVVHEIPAVALKRAGGVYQARCPFHEERSGSFTVYESRYTCFGCGVHGDVYDLCQQLLGITRWRDAVEYVAAYAGVPLPKVVAPVGPVHDVRVPSL